MPEVMRSKLFYARSSSMIAIPTYRLISDLQPIQMGILNSLLASVSKALVPSLLLASADGLMTQAVLDAIIAKSRYASREYFGRAWTLAGQLTFPDILCLFLILNISFLQSEWLGLDARRGCIIG